MKARRAGGPALQLVQTVPRDPAGELPPHDLQAERACLGAALVDRGAREVLCEVTRVEDFYDVPAQHVREALGDLRAADMPAEIVVLVSWLRDRQVLQRVGGSVYINDLSIAGCAPANVLGPALTVAGKGALRRWIASAQASVAIGYSPLEVARMAGPGDPTGAFAWIASELRRLGVVAPGGPENLDRFHVGAIAAESAADVALMQGGPVGAFIRTGIEPVDDVTGLYPNEVTLLGAPKGIGKTTLARFIADGVARYPRGHAECEVCAEVLGPCSEEHRRPRGVLAFALEGSRVDWSDYLAAKAAQLNLFHRRTGRWSTDQQARFLRELELLQRVSIVVDDRKDLNRANLGPRVRAWREWFAKRGATLELVVLDYFQIGAWERSGDGRESDLNDAGRHVIRLATDAESDVRGLAWLVIAALNKDGATRESQALEYHADTFWRLSEAKGKDSMTDARALRLWIEKQRRGPSRIGVPFWFDQALGVFW